MSGDFTFFNLPDLFIDNLSWRKCAERNDQMQLAVVLREFQEKKHEAVSVTASLFLVCSLKLGVPAPSLRGLQQQKWVLHEAQRTMLGFQVSNMVHTCGIPNLRGLFFYLFPDCVGNVFTNILPHSEIIKNVFVLRVALLYAAKVNVFLFCM